jgi:ribonuclease P protein component
MPTPHKHTFSRSERLKSAKQIEALFGSGKSFPLFPFRVFYRWESQEGLPQAGVGASKRNFKRAVDRNRIKRLIREGYRLQKQVLYQSEAAPGLRVFILYTGKDLPAFDLVLEKVGVILQKLSRLTREGSTTTP